MIQREVDSRRVGEEEVDLELNVCQDATGEICGVVSGIVTRICFAYPTPCLPSVSSTQSKQSSTWLGMKLSMKL